MVNVSLQAPDRGVLWAKLALTETQIAEMCGLTVRQVSHWAKQGYLTASPEHPDRYNGDAVDLCLLIKQARQAGLPLHLGVDLARAYVAAELTGQLAPEDYATTRLTEIATDLRTAQQAINETLTVLDLVAPAEAGPADVLSGAPPPAQVQIGPGEQPHDEAAMHDDGGDRASHAPLLRRDPARGPDSVPPRIGRAGQRRGNKPLTKA